MNSLRWFLVACTALLAIGFIALLIFADGFRRSFGASDNGPWIVALPLTAMFLFLASLVFPGQRALLHLAAVVALVLAGGSVWLLHESGFMGTMGLLYAGLWLAWYWQVAWQQIALSSTSSP